MTTTMRATTLQELILATHFVSDLHLSVVEMAAWVSAFKSEFKEFQQLPAGPRTELPTSALAMIPQFQMLPQMPRLILRSPNTGLQIQIQADRFVFGWLRSTPLGEPANYPGYAEMRLGLERMLRQFETWHADLLGRPLPGARLVEIGYHNAAPLVVNGQQQRLSDIFSFVQAGSRKLNGFQVAWVEALSLEPGAPQVSAQVGLGTAPPAIPVLAFQFVGLGPISGSALDPAALMVLDALHERIADMHAAAIRGSEPQ